MNTWNYTNTAGHDTHGQSAVYDETTGKDIAIVYDGKAHGPLIAAAPELLEAMPTADFWDLVRAGLRSDAGLVFKAVAEQELKAKAAINKATKGENAK